MIDNDIFIGKEYKEFLDDYRVYKEGFILNLKTGYVTYPENLEKPKNDVSPSFVYHIYFINFHSSIKIDKLVANLFCEKPLDENGKEYPGYKIEHLDGDVMNCDADNLRWIAPIKVKRAKNNKPICIYPEEFKKKFKPTAKSQQTYIYIDTWKKLWWEDTKNNIKEVLKISDGTFFERIKSKKLIKNRYIVTDDVSLALEYC